MNNLELETFILAIIGFWFITILLTEIIITNIKKEDLTKK